MQKLIEQLNEASKDAKSIMDIVEEQQGVGTLQAKGQGQETELDSNRESQQN